MTSEFKMKIQYGKLSLFIEFMKSMLAMYVKKPPILFSILFFIYVILNF